MKFKKIFNQELIKIYETTLFDMRALLDKANETEC
jgi:hypothetical protein